MIISEMQKWLESIKEEYGDIRVAYDMDGYLIDFCFARKEYESDELKTETAVIY